MTTKPISVLTEAGRRKKVATRLARVEGQIRGIRSMIETDTDCEQITIQMSAARRALEKAFYEMLTCGLMARMDDEASTEGLRQSIDELSRMLVKYG